jgi:hypothetical protein
VLQCLLHTTSFAEHMRGQDLNRITNGLSVKAREGHPLVFFRFAAPILISRMSNLIILCAMRLYASISSNSNMFALPHTPVVVLSVRAQEPHDAASADSKD